MQICLILVFAEFVLSDSQYNVTTSLNFEL